MTETVGPATDGERVDRVVALLTGLSRSEVADLVAEGGVAVDDRVVTTRSRRVSAGETIAVDVPVRDDPGIVGEPGVDFEEVYLDDDVVIVDKPAGLVVHPGAGHASGTLVHGLVARHPEIAEVGEPERPGIVHRLDRGTSGLLIVARSARAHSTLTEMMAGHLVERYYLGVAEGHVTDDEGVVDAPVGRSSRQPTKMTVTRDGRPARTRYRVRRRVRSPAELSVVDFELETGRTHQIRVHMAAIGHPLVGDTAYGGSSALCDRVALHAHRLRFEHPVTSETVDVTAPVPADLAVLLDRLGD